MFCWALGCAAVARRLNKQFRAVAAHLITKWPNSSQQGGQSQHPRKINVTIYVPICNNLSHRQSTFILLLSITIGRPIYGGPRMLLLTAPVFSQPLPNMKDMQILNKDTVNLYCSDEYSWKEGTLCVRHNNFNRNRLNSSSWKVDSGCPKTVRNKIVTTIYISVPTPTRTHPKWGPSAREGYRLVFCHIHFEFHFQPHMPLKACN